MPRRRLTSLVAAAFMAMTWCHAVFAEDIDVVVLGGTGQLGSEIVKVLVEAGERVSVFARPSSDRARLDGYAVTYVTGDLLVEADVERLFKTQSFDAVIDASGVPGDGNPSFYPESQKLISKWAAATSVSQIILHGSVGAGESADLFIWENLPDDRRAAFKAKTQAEEVLKTSGVPYTIIRHMTLLPLETRQSGNARLSEDRATIGAISRDGLATLTLQCLLKEECQNATFHAVDDDVELTGRYTKMLERYKQIFKPEILESYLDAAQ